MPGQIAEATACAEGVCETAHVLVRGTHIEFLSVEQVRRSGATRAVQEGDVIWSPRTPPADIRFPRGFVLVHDTTGRLLEKCDLYVVKWRPGGAKNAPSDVLADAREYFVDQSGRALPIRYGSVEIPAGSWSKIARVKYIRYRRAGRIKPMEHEYQVPVDLRYCRRPLAWRLPLPDGCVVDDRGFVWP